MKKPTSESPSGGAHQTTSVWPSGAFLLATPLLASCLSGMVE